MSRATFALSILAPLLLALAAGRADAACSDKKFTTKKDPLSIVVEPLTVYSKIDAPDKCTIQAAVTITFDGGGSVLATTWVFKDGETAVIDWSRKTIGGKHTSGVSVDFDKETATFKKAFARVEIVTKDWGKTKTVRFERAELLPAEVEEQTVVFKSES